MLAKQYKIRKKKDFEKIFQQGIYRRCKFLSIKFLKSDLEESRFAFIVGLKIAKKATVRNRLRRQLEEAARYALKEKCFGKAFDLVVMVKPEIKDADFSEIKKAFIELISKAEIIKK